MIGHDDGNAARPDEGDLFPVAHAAVDRDEQIGRPFGNDFFQRLAAHAIALFPLGNIGKAVRPRSLERGSQNRGRADAVRIVISEHRDQPALFLYAADRIDQFAHAAHQKGRKKMFFGRRKKPLRLFGRIRAAGKQDLRRQFPYVAGGGDCLHSIQLFVGKGKFRDDPFHGRAPLPDAGKSKQKGGSTARPFMP